MYLSTTPVLEERHRAVFESLEPTEVMRAVVRMQQDMVLPRTVRPEGAITGGWLFDLCRDRGLDHATTCFPLCRETDSIGVSALTKLVGRPITAWRPPPRAARPPTTPRVVGERTATASALDPAWVVLTAATNPKKPGSATWGRYRHWVPGRTLAECMRLGLTRADVIWDTDPSRRFVTLGTAAQWELQQRPGEEDTGG
jgi:hypothetical protein